MLEFEDLFLENWKRNLGLENEQIELNFLGNYQRIRDIDTGNTINGYISYDHDKKCYLINYIESNKLFTILHELGHLRIARKTNFEGFCSKEEFEKATFIENPDIYTYINLLFDQFVNYEILQWHDVRMDFMNDFEQRTKELSKTPEINYFNKLSDYIAFYCNYHFIFDDSDRKRFGFIPILLKNFENLINTGNNFVIGLLFQFDMNRIKNSLDQFKAIKNTTSAKEIFKFLLNVLYSIDLWSKNDIKNHLNYKFRLK